MMIWHLNGLVPNRPRIKVVDRTLNCHWKYVMRHRFTKWHNSLSSNNCFTV